MITMSDFKWTNHIQKLVIKAKATICWVRKNLISRAPQYTVAIFKICNPFMEPHCSSRYLESHYERLVGCDKQIEEVVLGSCHISRFLSIRVFFWAK